MAANIPKEKKFISDHTEGAVYLDPIKNDELLILEIGLCDGKSLRTWYEYLPNSIIIGLDIDDKPEHNNDRVFTFKLDQSDPKQLENFAKECKEKGYMFDMILDDGSHIVQHQYISWGALFPYVKSGGYYIIEDLHCNFFPKWELWKDNDVMITTLEAVQSLKEGEFRYQYLPDDQAQYIQDNIESIEIFDRTGEYDSITALIKKK
jgi:cephalosporin hydroxylase